MKIYCRVYYMMLICFFLCSCYDYIQEDYSDSIITDSIDNDYSLSLFLTKRTTQSQGLAIFNNTIFVFEAGGTCDVYDYHSRQFISSFSLGSANKDNHCNCANWGIDIPNGSSFPLLYMTNGNKGVPGEWHCKVERIDYDGFSFSSECVQTVILDTVQFRASNYLVPYGCPQWLIDRESGFLWVWSANVRTLPSISGKFENNLYHATKFRIPQLSEGEVVTLTASDVIEQVAFEFDAYSTQGGCMINGKILYSYGFGDDNSPSRIRIYDTQSGLIVKRIDLDGIINIELEDLAWYNNKMYVNTNSTALYEIDFYKNPF